MNDRSQVYFDRQQQAYHTSTQEKSVECLSTSPVENYFSQPRLDVLHLRGSAGPAGNGFAPRSHNRHESWYEDLLQHGLTERDIATLMMKENQNDDDTQSLSESGHQYEETFLEQHCLIAIAEAKQRLANLGFSLEHENTSTALFPLECSNNTTEQDSPQAEAHSILLPTVTLDSPGKNLAKGTADDEKIPIRTTLPSVAPKGFNWEIPSKWIDQKTIRRESDLEVGVLLPKNTKPNAGFVATRCRGCRRLVVVSSVSTLVRCPCCKTVSPVSTTRTY